MSTAIRSMTGFATYQSPAQESRGFTLSIKSVNHRHLDLQLRLPSGLDALEPPLRTLLKTHIRRGHVDLTLTLEKSRDTIKMEVDDAMLEAYVTAFRAASTRFAATQPLDLNALLRLPGVMSASTSPVDATAFEPIVLAACEALITQFQASRRSEGAALAQELSAAMARISALTDQARALRLEIIQSEPQRLQSRLAEVLAESGAAQHALATALSPDRLLAEAALLVTRGEVEEELVRLRTHTARFEALLHAGGEVGRQLDFLLQEMNRESNTLLAKTGGNAGAKGLELTDLGLAMKLELERAREQVQNLE